MSGFFGGLVAKVAQFRPRDARARILLLWLAWIAVSSLAPGCVVPLAPEFEDPPKAGNSPPYLVKSVPLPETSQMADVDFYVTVMDPNPRDRLYVRWVSDYPPYQQSTSKLLESREITSSPMGSSVMYQVPTNCENFKSIPNPPHRLVVIISDRPFVNPDIAENSEFRYNATETKTNPLMVGWNVTCRQ